MCDFMVKRTRTFLKIYRCRKSGTEHYMPAVRPPILLFRLPRKWIRYSKPSPKNDGNKPAAFENGASEYKTPRPRSAFNVYLSPLSSTDDRLSNPSQPPISSQTRTTVHS